MLAGYALQAEYGNFNDDKHRGDYFDPREFFPAWVSFGFVFLSVLWQVYRMKYYACLSLAIRNRPSRFHSPPVGTN